MEFNLGKLGKDTKHNVLYITGLPGSGKTTLAEEMADGRGSIIHLDTYAEGDLERQNPDFNRYLDNVQQGLRSLVEYGMCLEEFGNCIEKYGKLCFSDRIVIVEGFQIFTGWLHENDSFYLDKPLIILDTPMHIAITRMMKRDNLTTDMMAERVGSYQQLNREFLEFKEKFEVYEL